MIRPLAALLISTLLVACGSDHGSTESSPTTTATAQPSALIGAWQRTTTCQDRVRALNKAGLGKFAAENVAQDGFIPGVTSVDQLKDPKKPCARAVPMLHSHFFTADGLFGSRDADGNQVDDGTYTVPDARTLVVTKEFGDVTFHFEVQDNELLLTPVLPDCAKDGCFAALWSVAVAYPGLPWQRIE